MKNPYADPKTSRIDGISFPYLKERSIRLAESGNKLAYYTSASTAVSILKNREIWMRNVSLMNDYSEVQHGITCLKNAYVNDGAKFREFLDGLFSGLSDEVAGLFNSWQGDMRYNTYVTCISEHPSTEHENGRLSMWRAYGQPRPPLFLRELRADWTGSGIHFTLTGNRAAVRLPISRSLERFLGSRRPKPHGSDPRLDHP